MHSVTKRFIKTLSFFSLLISAISLSSQNNALIPVNDPVLKQRQIRCLHLDKKNRIWCGTDDGIYCYDGYQTIAFKNDKKNQVISDNFINDVCADEDSGLLLFATNKGVTAINPLSMQSLFVLNDGQNKDLSLGNVHHLIKVGKNEFWGLADLELFSLTFEADDRKIAVKKLNLDNDVNNKKIQLFSVVKKNEEQAQVYITSGDGVVKKVDRKDMSLHEIGNYRGLNAFQFFNNSIIFSSYGGIYNYDELSGQAKLLVPGEFNSMHVDKACNNWLVRDRTKLYRYGGANKISMVASFSSEEESKYQLIYSVAADKNNIWLGTAKGLLNVKMPKPCFSNLFEDVEKYQPGELSSRGMLRVNDTSVLLCGYHYFFSFNPLNNKITEMLPKKEVESLLPYALCKTGDSIWIATEGSGLKLFSFKKRKMLLPKFKNAENNLFVYRGLLRAATPTGDWIYLAEYGFVARLNYKTGRVESKGILTLDEGKFFSSVLQIQKHGKDELIFVSSDIIIVTDTSLNIKEKIKSETLSSDVKGLITCALPDSNGIWIGSNSKGLFYFNRKTKETRKLLTDDGLADNTIYSLVAFGNKIFIGTKNGLSVLDKSTAKISNYFEEDGLVNNEFNGSSFLQLSDSALLMGGIKGVTLIHPSLMSEKKLSPDFFLSKVLMAAPNGKQDTALLGDLDALTQIELPYQNRFLQIFYSLTNYSSFNRFAYKLEGASDQWIELGNQNQITFNSLEPGNYQLRIRAWDERGDPLGKEIILKITALQIFYKTTAFLVIMIILISVIVMVSFYLYYRIKIRNIQRLADLRLRIASDLHDQVGGLLNKTAIQAELASSKKGEQDQQLDKIALNSRTALNSMRDILWNLDPRNDNTGSLVERMKDYVVKMLEDDFVYELKIEDVEKIELSHEVRQNLNMIFKEAVNNIVKHAKGSRIKIFFGVVENQLVLTVHSSESLKGELVSSGQGMRNMRMRAEAIKAGFELDTNQGVSVNVKLPLNHMKM